jgi:hypothetical protein
MAVCGLFTIEHLTNLMTSVDNDADQEGEVIVLLRALSINVV